jgi:hypothetical protein
MTLLGTQALGAAVSSRRAEERPALVNALYQQVFQFSEQIVA